MRKTHTQRQEIIQTLNRLGYVADPAAISFVEGAIERLSKAEEIDEDMKTPEHIIRLFNHIDTYFKPLN